MEVTINATVEIEGVERDVELKYWCSPGEAPSRDCPGDDPTAEFQRGVFLDTGEDVVGYSFPSDYEEDALEKAAKIDDDAADAKDAAAEAKADARRDGD